MPLRRSSATASANAFGSGEIRCRSGFYAGTAGPGRGVMIPFSIDECACLGSINARSSGRVGPGHSSLFANA